MRHRDQLQGLQAFPATQCCLTPEPDLQELPYLPLGSVLHVAEDRPGVVHGLQQTRHERQRVDAFDCRVGLVRQVRVKSLYALVVEVARRLMDVGVRPEDIVVYDRFFAAEYLLRG